MRTDRMTDRQTTLSSSWAPFGAKNSFKGDTGFVGKPYFLLESTQLFTGLQKYCKFGFNNNKFYSAFLGGRDNVIWQIIKKTRLGVDRVKPWI